MTKIFLRRRDVERVTGLACSTIYLKMSQGDFPRPVPLGKRSVGWLESEIRDWQDRQISVRDGEAA